MTDELGDDARQFPETDQAGAVVVGIDLFERDRLRQSYERFGERLMRRLFTPAEVEQAGGRIERLAGRFAAKEACAKALGVGIGRVVSWQDIEITRLPGGKPSLRLRGGALARAGALGLTAFDVSISDTGAHVIAIVVGVRG